MPVALRDVVFAYPGELPVLAITDLQFHPGQVTALTGPSGSGKSTLLQLVGGLLHPMRGGVTGRPASAKIRWVFQTPTVLTRRSVRDNILLGVHHLRWDTVRAAEAADEAMSVSGLTHLASRPCGSLSGGEIQRVQIARALIGSPPLVLADEPTGQLDRANTMKVVAALTGLRQTGTIVVVATHDPLVASACDRRVELRDGYSVED